MTLNIPTILTWGRIAVIPLLVGVFYLPWPEPKQNVCALILFALSAITDWFDGYLARKWNQTSAFGAWLDPVADKLLVVACVIVLLHLNRIDMLVALIIIGREIAIASLREWMAQIGASANVAVAMIGKIKTVVQMVAIGFLLHEQDRWGLPVHDIGTVLIWMSAVLTLWSMIFYMAKAWPIIKSKTK